MENPNSIEEVIERIQEKYNSRKGYEEFKILLLDSGILKDSLDDFFMFPEGENFPTGISSYALKEKFLLNKDFLLDLALNLYQSLDVKRKGMLQYAFKLDGLTIDKDELYNKNKIVFEVQYNNIDRVLRVNGKGITRPRFNRENDNVFSYIYEHPNRLLMVDANDKLEGAVEVLKSLDDVVKNLRFSRNARQLFFPKVSDKEIEFRNPITLGELKQRGFDENITIDDLFPDKKLGTKRNKKVK
ncbi:MAG: hypothetical protein WCV59_03775 [Parcubacteria group bacterium]|jgi:hypothetical protein